MNRQEQKLLIERLRRLPPPAIPRGLEARLLAGAASPAAATPLRSQWRRRALAGGLAALAACAVVGLSLLRHPAPPTPPQIGTPDVSIQFVQGSNRAQETRPCDILPPLPSSL